MKISREDNSAVAALRPLGSIYLVGFMGAGKTSVGTALARLGWTFLDLDDCIEQREGRTIPAIFREQGEAGFRDAERAALQELLSQWPSAPRMVVALGGGAFCNPATAQLLAGAAVVFLDADADELWRRCQAQPRERPLRQDRQRFRELYEKRLPYYLRANYRVATSGKSVEQVAAELAGLFPPEGNLAEETAK
jgi:shikimate kinase